MFIIKKLFLLCLILFIGVGAYSFNDCSDVYLKWVSNPTEVGELWQGFTECQDAEGAYEWAVETFEDLELGDKIQALLDSFR